MHFNDEVYPGLVIFQILYKQEFDDYRDADDAVHDLSGRDFLGSKVVVEHARGPRRDRSGRDRRRPWVDKYGPPQRTDYRYSRLN